MRDVDVVVEVKAHCRVVELGIPGRPGPPPRDLPMTSTNVHRPVSRCYEPALYTGPAQGYTCASC